LGRSDLAERSTGRVKCMDGLRYGVSRLRHLETHLDGDMYIQICDELHKDESMNNSSSTQIPLSLPIYQRLFSQPTQPSTRSEMSAEAQRSSVPNLSSIHAAAPSMPTAAQPAQLNPTNRPPPKRLPSSLPAVGRAWQIPSRTFSRRTKLIHLVPSPVSLRQPYRMFVTLLLRQAAQAFA